MPKARPCDEGNKEEVVERDTKKERDKCARVDDVPSEIIAVASENFREEEFEYDRARRKGIGRGYSKE